MRTFLLRWSVVLSVARRSVEARSSAGFEVWSHFVEADCWAGLRIAWRAKALLRRDRVLVFLRCLRGAVRDRHCPCRSFQCRSHQAHHLLAFRS